MKVKETLAKLREQLRPLYGDRETEAIIRLIFHHLKGWNLTDMLIHQEDDLSPFIMKETEDILARLLKHEPIQYITGEARFHGMDFKVTRDVLIPRPETDELVDFILDETKDRSDLKVLDVGTGSGCIAISLARNLKFPQVMAIDVSQKALDIAAENASSLKTKVEFIRGDIFSWNPDKKFDVIVSNPPYITEQEKAAMEPNVLNFEPSGALFVPDTDPLVFYDRISDIAVENLVPGGCLYFEINPLYSKNLEEMLRDKGFRNVNIMRDISGKERFISARK